MFKKLETKTTSYKVSDNSNYIVDIVEHDDKWEAWIYHKDYGVKDLMYGLAKEQRFYKGGPYTETFETFIDTVEVSVEEYIAFYEEQYIDPYMNYSDSAYLKSDIKPPEKFRGMKDFDIRLQELAEATGYTKEFLTGCLEDLVRDGESYAEAYNQVEGIALEKDY